jgi:hypothetical protein
MIDSSHSLFQFAQVEPEANFASRKARHGRKDKMENPLRSSRSLREELVSS